MQRQQFRLRELRVSLLRPRTRHQDRGDPGAVRLQVFQLLLREVQDVPEDHNDARMQLRMRRARYTRIPPVDWHASDGAILIHSRERGSRKEEQRAEPNPPNDHYRSTESDFTRPRFARRSRERELSRHCREVDGNSPEKSESARARAVAKARGANYLDDINYLP